LKFSASVPIECGLWTEHVMPVNDLSIYELDAATWWDDQEGPMAPLHWLTPPRFRYFARVAGPLTGKSVLDIGCGGGLLADHRPVRNPCQLANQFD
jgi:2-polyprenyl-3-methyl-5-hydroxy-6-metoxy-1,4-benzoquinol methylase